ncbi:uncharacterized protein V1510DRAFT_403705 [Dipodascopsis tothii]|uniref:uncharacterized protein n=1 Tax=Dipodascopsis tothii TaxID=44089 RepID=UPI0034CD6AE8
MTKEAYTGLGWASFRIYLIGSLAYMIMHWAWWKLELDELTAEKTAEIGRLETLAHQLLEDRVQPTTASVAATDPAASRSWLRRLWSRS